MDKLDKYTPHNELNVRVHETNLDENGVLDPDTLQLARDVWEVSCSVYQGMPVIGPWLEQRVAWLVQSWLPGWRVSSGQIFDLEIPYIRSRSWDLIVHRDTKGFNELPPEARPGSGPPVVPRHLCCAVIDTKNYFNDPTGYAQKAVFNLMNDEETPQLTFLGESISKNILACSSNLRPATVEAKGRKAGINVFVLGRYTAGPVAREREVEWQLWPGTDEGTPLQRFRAELERAATAWIADGTV